MIYRVLSICWPWRCPGQGWPPPSVRSSNAGRRRPFPKTSAFGWRRLPPLRVSPVAGDRWCTRGRSLPSISPRSPLSRCSGARTETRLGGNVSSLRLEVVPVAWRGTSVAPSWRPCAWSTEKSGAVHSSTRLSQNWIKRDSPEFVFKYGAVDPSYILCKNIRWICIVVYMDT